MKNNTHVFEVVTKNQVANGKSHEIIEVWLPPVNNPEGEMVLCISTVYVPALIATLRGLPSAKPTPARGRGWQQIKPMKSKKNSNSDRAGVVVNAPVRLLNAITDALREMDRCPDDSVQDIWNESLESWETGLRMDHNLIIEPNNLIERQ